MMKPAAEAPRLKSKGEILAECAAVGIVPGTPSIFIAARARASNSFLALKNAA